MEPLFDARGAEVEMVQLFNGQQPPPCDSFDLLIVLGGPMGVDDEAHYPWLAAEKQYIKTAIGSGIAILGICLGAQLIATVLGAAVTRNREPEIGWFAMQRDEATECSPFAQTLPQQLTAFHWHGDTFALPDGAIPLYRSAACDNQGFIYDERIIALQFHLETTAASARALVKNCADELQPSPYVQDAQTLLNTHQHYAQINDVMRQVIDYLCSYSTGNS